MRGLAVLAAGLLASCSPPTPVPPPAEPPAWPSGIVVDVSTRESVEALYGPPIRSVDVPGGTAVDPLDRSFSTWRNPRFREWTARWRIGYAIFGADGKVRRITGW